MSSLRPVDEVTDELLALVCPGTLTEIRSLDDSLNCCLAEDIQSPLNVPPGDNSAMDGYAIAIDSAALNKWMVISDRIPAGHMGKSLALGTAARIFTGAQIPAGADTVIMQENTESDGDKVRLLSLPEPLANVRSKGQDIKAGSIILRKGDRLSSNALALVASVGVSELQVMSPLKVAIMSTGDELVEPGSEPAPGQIYNSNRYALAGMLKNLGMQVIDLGIVGDTPEETERALIEASKVADCIIASGGVSVGEEDHVKAAVEKLGHINIWKMAIKPGKPLAYGVVDGVPFFGLPGNPVSTFVTFHIVAKPYLLAMQGFSDVRLQAYSARASFEFRGGSRREYLRVRTRLSDDGEIVLDKFPNQGSGIMTSVVWADALAEVEISQQVKPGDLLKIYPISHL